MKPFNFVDDTSNIIFIRQVVLKKRNVKLALFKLPITLVLYANLKRIKIFHKN